MSYNESDTSIADDDEGEQLDEEVGKEGCQSIASNCSHIDNCNDTTDGICDDYDEDDDVYFLKNSSSLIHSLETHEKPMLQLLKLLKVTVEGSSIDAVLSNHINEIREGLIEHVKEVFGLNMSCRKMLDDQYSHLGEEVLSEAERDAIINAKELYSLWKESRGGAGLLLESPPPVPNCNRQNVHRNNGDDTTSLGGDDDELICHFHSTDGGVVVQSPNRDVSLPPDEHNVLPRGEQDSPTFSAAAQEEDGSSNATDDKVAPTRKKKQKQKRQVSSSIATKQSSQTNSISRATKTTSEVQHELDTHVEEPHLDDDPGNSSEDEESQSHSHTAQHETVDTISFCDKLISQVDTANKKDEIVVADTFLLKTSPIVIQNIFQLGKINRLIDVGRHLISVLGPLFQNARMMATYMKAKAGKLDKVPRLSSTDTWLEMLCGLEAHSKSLDMKIAPEVEAALTKLKHAITRHEKQEELKDPETEIQDILVSDSAMKDFLQVGHFTTNLSTHILELSIVYKWLSNISMHQIYWTHGKYNELLAEAIKLARLVDDEFEFDDTTPESTSVLDYVIKICNVAFGMDEHWEVAWKVFITIKNQLTNIQNPDRKALLDRSLIDAATNSYANEEDDASADRSNLQDSNAATDIDNNTKRCMITLFFSILGERAIMRALPVDKFNKNGGFIRSLIRLSPTDVYKHCRVFFKKSFFKDARGEKKFVDDLCTNLLPDKVSDDDKSGKRSIVVPSREIVDSLRFLVEQLPTSATS